jgi:hypothetical protein
VDLVHQSTVNRFKGYAPLPPLDLGRPCPSDGPGRMWATGGGETAGAGGGAAVERRRLTGDLDLGLWCTVFSAVSSYVKLRSSRTYPDQKGGVSGDHDGAPWPAADGRPRHTAATVLTARGARKRKEAAPSP